MIYLDNAATTPISEEVLEEMMPYLTNKYGNPGAIYSYGAETSKAVSLARERVAKVFSCSPDNIIFTSGGSEGNNMVISGLRQYLSLANKKYIITSSVEHNSVLNAIHNLVKYDGFVADYLDVNNECMVNPCDIMLDIANQDINIGLVSVMYVNNETGSVNHVKMISDICKSANILFHTDCVQAAGLYDLDVQKIGCDFATISSHKINGPKGVGAIYANNNVKKIVPIISGGESQEFGFRGGTENVAGIVGFGKACEIMLRDFDGNKRNVKNISSYIIDLIHELIPGAIINCPNYGKIISVTVPGVDTQSLIILLSDYVAISAGSACSAHSNNTSHVLKAMGLSDEDAFSTFRISISPQLDKESALIAIKRISEGIKLITNLK